MISSFSLFFITISCSNLKRKQRYKFVKFSVPILLVTLSLLCSLSFFYPQSPPSTLINTPAHVHTDPLHAQAFISATICSWYPHLPFFLGLNWLKLYPGPHFHFLYRSINPVLTILCPCIYFY